MILSQQDELDVTKRLTFAGWNGIFNIKKASPANRIVVFNLKSGILFCWDGAFNLKEGSLGWQE